MNSYSRNWNIPYWTLIVTAGEFQNEIWTLEERYAIKFCCNFVSVSVQNGEAIIFIVGPATWHVLDEKALAILLF